MKEKIALTQKITDLCDKIINDIPEYPLDGQIVLVGVDGPTASGKTIFADHLSGAWNERRQKGSFVYRLDWALADRIARVKDLGVLKKGNSRFELEAELHMRLGELENFLKEVLIYNENFLKEKSCERPFKKSLEGLYSREDNGRLTGVCNVEIPPGSLIIVEGHYTLRSELHRFFDLNVLMLGNKKTLIERKIARVSGYRGAEDAESYFHFIDAPSFEHHLYRFGHNATHIIQNNDFLHPTLVPMGALNEWCGQHVAGELEESPDSQDLSHELDERLDQFFTASSLAPKIYRTIASVTLSKLGALDKQVSQKVRMSVNEQTAGLSEVIQHFIVNLNETCKSDLAGQEVELKFTNSLHNVYFRIFPISFALGLASDPFFSILVDIYEEKIEGSIVWKGGAIRLISNRGLDIIEENKSLQWSISKFDDLISQDLDPSEITLLSPTNFTIPPIFQDENYTLKITGKEELNISSSECFQMLSGGNLCWVARLSLQSEVEFFGQMCLLVGAQVVEIGNYLVALKSNNPNINRNFKHFAKSWMALENDCEDAARDKQEYDGLVITERSEIERIVGDDKFLKVLDTHIFLKEPLIQRGGDGDFEGVLRTIKTLLLSKNRLMRKRIVQFIQRQFGIIELPINKIWNSFENNKSTIPISDLTSMQPSIMAELYLWMSIRSLPSAILGANVYDISKDSLDAYGHLKAAINENMPVVLQASLNALGPCVDGGKTGYLQANNGASDLILAIQSSLRALFIKNGGAMPLYGIGLDHVDSRNDFPSGRARKFLEKSLATGLITHIVLDGSSLFKAKDSSIESLTDAYDMVSEYAATLAEGIDNMVLIDKEICGGELNYIGADELANVPDAAEMGLFVDRLKANFRKKKLGSFLRRPILFIGNVGTTHHSGDVGEVRSEVTGEWVDAVKKNLFVAAVLHGTTGSKAEVLKRALVGCKKVNIAGDFLKTYISALPKKIQNKVADLEPKEPKRALARLRDSIQGLSLSERENISESVYEHSRSVMQAINSPTLTNADKNFFRYSTYIFNELEIDEILNQIKSHFELHDSAEPVARENELNRLTAFSASLIEVPYGQEFISIVNLLMSAGIVNFHIDVGDGKLISRKFSGLAKLKKLQELNNDIAISTHLMVRDPHLTSEEHLGQNYIESYAKNGSSRIGIHLKSVSDVHQASRCFDEIRLHGSEPGIVIEVDEPFSGPMGELILKNDLRWVVVMGVRIGFGGQIFNAEVLQKIAAIKHFSDEQEMNICIEVDGGLTMGNIGVCRRAGADLLAGWSIIKPEDSMTLLEKLAKLKLYI
jgi:ribulose-phosphate 3-epimerase